MSVLGKLLRKVLEDQLDHVVTIKKGNVGKDKVTSRWLVELWTPTEVEKIVDEKRWVIPKHISDHRTIIGAWLYTKLKHRCDYCVEVTEVRTPYDFISDAVKYVLSRSRSSCHGQ